MTTTDEFAPYPRTEDTVTADKLARSMAVAAQVAYTLVDATMGDRDAAEGPGGVHADTPLAKALGKVARLTTSNTVERYGIVRLLRALIEHAPEHADEVARDLWQAWNDGSTLGEETWEWLAEYGIDADAVTQVATAKAGAR